MVNLWGDDNNRGSFSGDAATVAGLDARLVPGNLTQNGSNNSILLDVGESGAEADDNQFAMLQDGNDNSIVGSINGNGNQAVVAQQSNGSTANFSQMGNFNNLGVSQ